MEKFLKLLNLNSKVKEKISDIEVIGFNSNDELNIHLLFKIKNKLVEEDYAHLISSLKKLDLPFQLEEVKIKHLLGILTASEIYSYLIKLIPIFETEINNSHLYIELSHSATKLFVTNYLTYKKIEKFFYVLSKLLFNSSIIVKPLELVLDFVEKREIATKSIEEKKEKLTKNTSNNFVRPGFKLLNPSTKEEKSNIYFEGKAVECKAKKVKTKNGIKVIRSFIVGNNENAVLASHWGSGTEGPIIKEGSYLRVYGNWKYDLYRKEYKISIDNYGSWQYLNKEDLYKPIIDNSPVKRSELHIHTKMSYMDGVGSVEGYIEKAREIGLNAIAITDHDSVQTYPEILNYLRLNNINNLKIIYGVELSILDDLNLKIVWNERDRDLLSSEYVFFDLETTGISPLVNKLIEFGGVKYKNGTIIDTLQFFINPEEEIPPHITELTNIKTEDVKNGPSIKEALLKIKEWIGDSILVAHNAKFDFDFLNAFFRKYNLGRLENIVIDTMGIARLVLPKIKNHQLGTIAKAEFIIYNEMDAHRADYDALILQKTYENLLHKLLDRGIRNVNQLNEYISKILNFSFPQHVIVLAKNQDGIKDIYKIISMAHTTYFSKERDRVVLPLSKLLEMKKNLILGSACSEGFVWNAINSKSENLSEIIKMFDYIEIFPPNVYDFLIKTKKFTKKEIEFIIKEIINIAENTNIPVVATSNAHYINKEDKIIRDVYIHNKGIKGRRHPLFSWKYKNIEAPEQYLRTTSEMISDFEKFLDKSLVNKIVISNSNLIVNLIEKNITPLKDKLYTPQIANTKEEFLKLIEENILKNYGKNIKPIIEKRIKREIEAIIKHEYLIIYYLSSLVVKKSLEDGFLVGSRGSVGSSFAATMSNITEVNPLPPHYKCNHCKYHEFIDGIDSGFDLLDKKCPSCGEILKGEGHNIPFETFLGFDGDKIPDIDLNFSREYQSHIHKYIKNFLGEKNVYRAGTISTVANRTAFGYIKNYLEETKQDLEWSNSKIAFLAKKVEGTKRTTGQHPGGLIVVPNNLDINDFSPINFPGNDQKSEWKTTHFDFHSIHDNLLKLDLLGHLDPSSIRMLEKLTKVSPFDIPMNDKKVIQLFESNAPLQYIKNYTNDNLGIIGLPEFGTEFVRRLVIEAKPKSFADLIRVSGLSHGTNVWAGNARELILNEGKKLEEVISTRDDIMTYLIDKGIDKLLSFQIMESIRKGKGLTPEWEKIMRENGVPNWYIKSSKLIKYMFPKAHATAYVLMAYRVAWYKIYYPLEYYATFFTKRDTEWDIGSLYGGIDAIKKFRKEIASNKFNASERERLIVDTYEIVLEMISRGYKIEKISISKSLAATWQIDKETNSLIPPFLIIGGLGEVVANKIIEEREKKMYVSKKDFKERSSVNSTIYKYIEELGLLDEFQDINKGGQITLF